MKKPQIKFFSPEENTPAPIKEVQKNKPTGYVSESGKLVFQQSTLEEIGVEPETALFKIGTDEGKRKIKSLYLIPTEESEGSFSFAKVGRGSGIPLSVILKRGGIDFEGTKHIFAVSIFNYSEGVAGFQLDIEPAPQKEPYTGKPRGRKRKESEQ